MLDPDQLYPAQEAPHAFADRVVVAALHEQRRSWRVCVAAQIVGTALLPLAVLAVGARGMHVRAERVEQLGTLVSERRIHNEKLRSELDEQSLEADALEWVLAHPSQWVAGARPKGGH